MKNAYYGPGFRENRGKSYICAQQCEALKVPD